jgi:flagellar hook-basal body complex protein FliE
MGLEDDRKDDDDGWTMIVQKNSSCNKNLTPPVFTTVKNVFAILSVSSNPTTNTNAPASVPSPIALEKDNKTIMPPSPWEHCRQQQNAQHQHIKQTRRQLCKSDNLFLNNSITHAEDKCTAFAKGNTNNLRHVVINSAHAQCNQPTIGLAQCGCSMAYHLGSVLNRMIKKFNRNKHVSFTKQNKVHLYDATATPGIMLTYDSGADGHYISKQDQCKVDLPTLQPST